MTTHPSRLPPQAVTYIRTEDSPKPARNSRATCQRSTDESAPPSLACRVCLVLIPVALIAGVLVVVIGVVG